MAGDEVVILSGGIEQFDAMISQLRPLLDKLLAAPKHARGTHPRGTIPAKPGLYLFSDLEGKPIYVGQSRNIRNRVAQHCNETATTTLPRSRSTSRRRTATQAGVDIAGYRSDIVAREDFVTQFLAAKQLVATMPVQFVVEEHPDVRTVFEVYATHALGTQEYNTFETH